MHLSVHLQLASPPSALEAALLRRPDLLRRPFLLFLLPVFILIILPDNIAAERSSVPDASNGAVINFN